LLPNFAVPGYFKELIQLIQQPHAKPGSLRESAAWRVANVKSTPLA